jgi:hypothetical protein
LPSAEGALTVSREVPVHTGTLPRLCLANFLRTLARCRRRWQTGRWPRCASGWCRSAPTTPRGAARAAPARSPWSALTSANLPISGPIASWTCRTISFIPEVTSRAHGHHPQCAAPRPRIPGGWASRDLYRTCSQTGLVRCTDALLAFRAFSGWQDQPATHAAAVFERSR